ncbi:MAG TPA: hypothetical protein VIJ28_10290, partial [Chloroflexota bacterium]
RLHRYSVSGGVLAAPSGVGHAGGRLIGAPSVIARLIEGFRAPSLAGSDTAGSYLLSDDFK